MDRVPETFFVSVCFLTATLIRWSIGAGSYSGIGKPPMYGDYEAQRHWHEITINTPPDEWYRNTTNNDLQYWGLDYPPLTAYHSWILGKIAEIIDPKWVALYESRGTESYHHKLFMRYSVLFADLLIFFPAIYLVSKEGKKHLANRETLLAGLFYPGLILIDYGHFQYNNISLGLFLFATYFFQKSRFFLGAFCFCLALNYKQMELYHSIPFFCFLLGRSLQKGFLFGTLNVIKLGAVVLGTFGLCWLPFLSSLDSLVAVVDRLFPVNRGLYEDKVANFWCAVSPILKLKEVVTSADAVKMCIVATLLSSLPSAVHLLRYPTVKAFSFSCVTVPLGFFLFSYQVHEKSILIPAVSACLLYDNCPFLVSWLLLTSVFSMTPLLQKDGLMIQFYVAKYVFMLLLYIGDGRAIKPGADLMKLTRSITCTLFHSSTIKRMLQFAIICSFIGSELLTLLLVFVKPPSQFPDLWPVGISVFSCAHFVVFLALFTALQLRCSNAFAIAESKKIS